MEQRLKNTKMYFQEETKRLTNEFQKDKEKFNLIIKIKDEEIDKIGNSCDQHISEHE